MNKIINKLALVSLTVACCGSAHAAITSDQKLVEQFNQNSIYNCDAKELGAFIEESTKPLFLPLPIPNSEQFTNAEVAAGGDPCLSLFNNLDALKDLQKVMDVIQSFQMPSMPSMDAVTVAAKILAQKMAAMATQSVCNAATKNAAMVVINQAMHNKIGFSIDEAKKFDGKAYARGLAEKEVKMQLGNRGIEDKWIYGKDKKDYENMIHDEGDDRAQNLLKTKGHDLVKKVGNDMFK